ncbi:HEPN domain-containing protein [Geobacter sp.]|uniref:HEPN domain-containing protein n=1 Tax=Geobacter sp. TaxID=46610 RepID=UPI0026039CB5|nr:HEPN domain-containing protein [Geobacter sp.]
MTGTLRELSAYRLSQARDSLREADVLLREGMSLRSVINRLYYAMFYAVLALLQTKQLGTSKHSGAIALFDREFVKTGIFPRALSKALHRAFELRQKGDYMEEAEITPTDVDEIRPLAMEFVDRVEPAIRQL